MNHDILTVPSMEVVALGHKGILVTKVPLLNFETFAPEKVRDLVKISGSEPWGWKFYAYDASVISFETDVERWASWLICRDIHNVVNNGSDIGDCLEDAKQIGDLDYQDALVDKWMLWLQEGKSAARLSVERLRYRFVVEALFEFQECLRDLGKALVLHHDAEAGTTEDTGGSQHYQESTREAVRVLAQNYFVKPGRESKDPLQLSANEFC